MEGLFPYPMVEVYLGRREGISLLGERFTLAFARVSLRGERGLRQGLRLRACLVRHIMVRVNK